MSAAIVRGYDNRYALTDLWGQAFGDDGEFISEMYACGYLNPSDVFALTEDGRLMAALFLPEYRIRIQGKDLPIRLLSCVATDPYQQGKGYMSLLISRTLELIRNDCCGVCVIPVSERLYGFYEKFGFSTAFWISERVIDPGEPSSGSFVDFSPEDPGSYYDGYFRKYANDGYVYKTKERFLQAVKEYTHPTQPCEFCTYSDGFAFIQRNAGEILVREWTGNAEVLGKTLGEHYRFPVRIQSPAGEGERRPIGMLCSFSESLTALAETSELYLNCMYN